MRAWRALLLVSLSASSACARKPVVSPAPGPTPQARIASADALLAAGCLDCLLDAFHEYDSLRSSPVVGDAAATGAVQAATLVALRERDLGLSRSTLLDRAHQIASTSPALQSASTPLFEIVDSLPGRQSGSGRQVSNDEELAAAQKAYRNREAWTARLRSQAANDPMSAYMWLAFNCVHATPTNDAIKEWVAVTPSWRDVPLVAFKAATCGRYDGAALGRLLAANPRFVELNFFLGLEAILAGKLDDAAELLQRAYGWRPEWPGVTLQLAHLYLSAEEFSSAADYYERTLHLQPESPEALLGKVKALTYLGRHDDAVATVDALLALGHWYIGDARYWRALNEAQLARYDEAWTDVELAAKLIANAEVPKLAGIIAYRRQQLDTSRAKFEESRLRNPSDCEVGFYLEVVLADQGRWPETAEIAPATAVCFDNQEIQLLRQIEEIRAKTMAPERQARQIDKREQQIAGNRRMRANCWFNAAVASFNLKKPDDVRKFAEHVADDEQFGGRVKELLSRVR